MNENAMQSIMGLIVNAHNSQTAMLTKEASGEHIPVTLLLVHSQDHLMTAITYIDLAK